MNVIDLQAKPEAFCDLYRQASTDPAMSAKVPLLETDEGVLIESMVIVEYLEDQTAEQSSLTAVQRARARLFATLFPTWMNWVGVLRADPDSEEEAAAVAKLREGMRCVNSFLAATDEEGPFLFGSEFSFAESATAPFIQRLAAVLPGMRAPLDPKAWMEEEGLTRLAAWTEAVCSRPSCVSSIPPAEELVDSYSKLMERMKAMPAGGSK
jgi:glutathione S-transferase